MSASRFSHFSNLREGEGGSGLWEREGGRGEGEGEGAGAYCRCPCCKFREKRRMHSVGWLVGWLVDLLHMEAFPSRLV